MSLPEEVRSCAICPRLCRDVCPVAVHARRDDLIPSEKMRAVAALMGNEAGVRDLHRLLACTDCRACTESCLLSVPVGPWLDASRQRWVAETGEPLPPSPEDPPALDVVDAEALPTPVYVLSTCGGEPDGCRSALRLGEGSRSPRAAGDVAARRDDPWPSLAGREGVTRHDPPMGSTCCGQRLRGGVGDPDLAHRMARAMVSGIPDGSLVIVADGACGAHIQGAVAGRLRVALLAEGGRVR